jgi:DNA-binding GntR family transcriptional regulator
MTGRASARRGGTTARHIATCVAHEVGRRTWECGESLPRARGLARQYRVSRGMARRALELLVDWGVAEIARSQRQRTRYRVRQRRGQAQVRTPKRFPVDPKARRKAEASKRRENRPDDAHA